MKQFDQLSIKNRLVGYIQAQPGWQQIIGDSTTTLIADASSESQAENARYTEYNVKESKWALAKNLPSLFYQSEFLGYELERKQSSVGTLVIAIDGTLNSKAGISIFSPSDISTNSLSPAYLIPYTNSVPALIPKGTACTGGGLNFITTADISLSAGMNYVLVPIMQGIIQTQAFSVAGLPLETVPIINSQIEAGVNSYSSQFFSVIFTPTATTTNIPINIINDIYLAAEDEYSCQMRTDMNNTTVTFTFGNNITGKQLSSGTVTISYIQTLGDQGNLTALYNVNSINATYSGNPFYCTNLTTILGGKKEDSIEDIRGKAPSQYLLQTGIVTVAGYKKAISAIPSILQAYVYSGTYFDAASSQTKSAIYYTAIQTDGTIPDTSSFSLLVDNQVLGNNSPLDYLLYSPLTFQHIRINIKGKTTQKNVDLNTLNLSIQTALFNQYGTLSHTFMQNFDASSVTSYISNNFSVNNISSRVVEAVTDLIPSKFTPDLSNINYYKQSFSFDPGFVSLKTYSSNETLYYLRIDIVFCPTCMQKSRTIFIIPSPTTPGGISTLSPYCPISSDPTIKYTYIQYLYSNIQGNITDSVFMNNLFNFSLSPIKPIAIADSVTPYVPFIITLDLSSFSPTGVQLLGSGTLSIPTSLVNFTASPSTLNATLQVQVIGEPVSGNITPVTQGSFLQTNPSSLTNFISDIIVSISN
jgi:hypothetical protein